MFPCLFTIRNYTLYNKYKPISQTTFSGRMDTMKKIIKYLTLAFLAGSFAFGLAQNKQPLVKTEATTVETKRVWMKNSITNEWDKDGAGTAIHYWGGAEGTTWPGARTKWDENNGLVYFDLPVDVTTYMFVRVSGSDPISDWGAKTGNLTYTESIGKYYNLTGPIAWDGATTPGTFVIFTPVTTTVVANFAATLDTIAEICTEPQARAAIDAYNNLSTFEQDQFDALPVGDPEDGKTGLDRLNYLKTRFNITTTLNARSIPESEKTLSATLVIGSLGITSLLGYYFINKKRIPQ